MKFNLGTGQLTDWFINVDENELLFITMVSPDALHKMCVLLTLDIQLYLES
jgi:hypothetical protein